MQAGLRHDTPRDAATPDATGAQRRCIASGRLCPRQDLLRFVVDPGGKLTPDIAGRLPGRGIWLSPDRDSVKRACARKLFDRAARRTLTVDADLDRRVEALLAARCIELIGLARRAGQAVAGFEKVRAWLREGRAALLLAGYDGAADGREKLQRLAGDRPVLDCLSTDELGRAFGRDRAVHVALSAGALAAKFEEEARKLNGFRIGTAVNEDRND